MAVASGNGWSKRWLAIPVAAYAFVFALLGGAGFALWAMEGGGLPWGPETAAASASISKPPTSIPAGPTTVYCNTGHTAALDWFALRMILNRPETLLYDGSMTEWTQDEARPVEV